MRFSYTLLTACYCYLIFWLSSQSQPIRTDFPIEGLDKIAHLVQYGILTALVSMGLQRSGNEISDRTQIAAPILFAVFYALTDEFHQAFVPGRHLDPLDIVADAAGACLVQVFLCRRWGVVWRLDGG